MDKAIDTRRGARVYIGVGLLLMTLACTCGPLQQVQDTQGTVVAAQSTLAPVLTVAGSTGGLGSVVAGAELRQWAANAGGSSQRSDGDFSFSQVTGLPNTPYCGDATSAWASDPSELTPILTADFATAVIPTQVVIHHAFNPGAVTKVDVSDGGSLTLTIYEGAAFHIVECPFEQVIDITPGTVPFPVSEVIISFDQTDIGGQNEIDAIELVGIGQ